MHTRKFIIAGLLSTTSLSVLALIGAQQAQINNFKPFVVIVTVVYMQYNNDTIFSILTLHFIH
jgi:hypothetical protein